MTNYLLQTIPKGIEEITTVLGLLGILLFLLYGHVKPRVKWAIVLLLLFIVSWLQRDGLSLRTKIEAQPLLLRWGLIIAAMASVIFFGVYGPGFDASQFIYFQF